MGDLPFPLWFYFGFLNHMGWPRKRGLFKKEPYVLGAIADGALRQLLLIARSIGAGDRQLAISLLASMWDRDWSEDLEDFGELLDRLQRVNAGSFDAQQEIPFGVLTSQEMRAHIMSLFSATLWGALKDPDPIREEMDNELAGGRARATEFASVGLNVDPGRMAESFQEHLAQSRVPIEEYEAVAGSLGDPPTGLMRYLDTHYPQDRR